MSTVTAGTPADPGTRKSGPKRAAANSGKPGKAPSKKPATDALAAKPPKMIKPQASGKVKKPDAKGTPTAPSKQKTKLVRDSFTIPKSEYVALEALKSRGMSLARPVKKSELLRAGIVALMAMSDKAFLEALSSVPSLKTGRPKRAKPATERKG